MFDFESGDKNIHDIIEGPPRMEAPKVEGFISQDNLQKNIMSQKNKTRVFVTKGTAHKVALGLLSNSAFVQKLKEIIAEKLVKKEHITRLDQAVEKSPNKKDYELYGLTEEHIADIKNGNFLNFNLVKDGPDIAIGFTKITGDKGIRPIDDVVLAEMLNRIFSLYPELDSSRQERISLN